LKWIKQRGYVTSTILVVVWPLLSVPAGVFTKSFFAFWVFLAVSWAFVSASIIIILPIIESHDDIIDAFHIRNFALIADRESI